MHFTKCLVTLVLTMALASAVESESNMLIQADANVVGQTPPTNSPSPKSKRPAPKANFSSPKSSTPPLKPVRPPVKVERRARPKRVSSKFALGS
jgi:hypothetical protein